MRRISKLSLVLGGALLLAAALMVFGLGTRSEVGKEEVDQRAYGRLEPMREQTIEVTYRFTQAFAWPPAPRDKR